MKLLVTGASGFIGRHVVAAALRCGHQVRAVVRPARDLEGLPWHPHPDVELARLDLRSRHCLVQAVGGVDAVVHLAGGMSGTYQDQFRCTVVATENLLEAMVSAGVHRLVAISSIAVYDYVRARRRIDENTVLEQHPQDRDDYARTKLIQERLVRDFAASHHGMVTILRPGVVFGRDHLWTARIGARAGNWWCRIGARAPLPLIYVENLADAILRAVEQESSAGKTLNLVDDETPTQSRYVAAIAGRLEPPPVVIGVNFTLMRVLARLAAWTNRFCFGGRARLPGLLVSPRLLARCRPLGYTNQQARDILGWQPRFSLETALERSFSDVMLLGVPTGASDPDQPAPPHGQTDACASPT